MKKNRIWISVLVLAFSIGLLFGCGNADTVEGKNEEKISIVCTVFPQYDWVKQVIAGQEERFDVTLLLDNGTDLHNYQPTASDMVKIADCDVLIYVGGESDEWVEDAIEEAVNPNMQVIDMMEKIWGTPMCYSFCILNSFKYRMRMGTKPGGSLEEDLRKEQWYLKKAEELKEKLNQQKK